LHTRSPLSYGAALLFEHRTFLVTRFLLTASCYSLLVTSPPIRVGRRSSANGFCRLLLPAGACL
jgi:hypothetical protein